MARITVRAPEVCPSCGVFPGWHHLWGCMVEQCYACHTPLQDCQCKDKANPLRPLLPWGSNRPGLAFNGWYAKLNRNGKWLASNKEDSPNIAEDDVEETKVSLNGIREWLNRPMGGGKK